MVLIIPLKLTDSLASLGKSDFESVLCEELRRECLELLVRGLSDNGAYADGDAVDIRVSQVEIERFTGAVLATVSVSLPGKAPSHFAKQHTIRLNPGAEGTERDPKASHYIDTDEWYREEDLGATPSAEGESSLAESLETSLRKLEASEFEREKIDKLAVIVRRLSQNPHSERVQVLLAELRKRIDPPPEARTND